ncbi:MAG: dihydrodipicolinate synthase family protein [Bacillota bacterium]|nr:dihydrodipicolinate synthase family protein [Bacillota bacterium]
MVKDFKFRGIFCPLTTPYKENLDIDYDDLRNEIEFCVHSGMHGIVTNVNAAEFYTLTDEEHSEIAKVTARKVGGRLPLVAGITGWSAKHSVERAKYAEFLGCDAVMSMPPVIAKPIGYDDIRRFYDRLDKAVNIPICIQNAPPTGPSLTPEQVFRIARECEHVVYVKEETEFESDYVSEMAAREKLEKPGVFKGVMSGNSGLTLIDCYLRGACGCMPSAHIGDVFAELWGLIEAGKTEEACAMHDEMTPFLLYESFYWVANFNFGLWKRGIIKLMECRAKTVRYDSKNIEECSRLIKPLEKYFKIRSLKDLQ